MAQEYWRKSCAQNVGEIDTVCLFSNEIFLSDEKKTNFDNSVAKQETKEEEGLKKV